MPIADNYIGRSIYIRSEKGEELAKTIVREHNREYMIITVEGNFRELAADGPVTVLLLSSNGVHEYKGKVRKTGANLSLTDIALYNGKRKESRAARRYVVNTVGTVEGLVFGGVRAPMLNPLAVSVVNLSSTGALLQASPNYFTLHAILELKINIGGVLTTLYGKIVWSKNVDPLTAQYGCQFVSLQ